MVFPPSGSPGTGQPPAYPGHRVPRGTRAPGCCESFPIGDTLENHMEALKGDRHAAVRPLCGCILRRSMQPFRTLLLSSQGDERRGDGFLSILSPCRLSSYFPVFPLLFFPCFSPVPWPALRLSTCCGRQAARTRGGYTRGKV